MYLELVKAADDAEVLEALADGNYSGLEGHYTLKDADYAEVVMVGTERVDLVAFAGMRCYTHEAVEVARGSDGKLYVTEEQEEEYFL